MNDVSVIISNYNQLATLPIVLQSMAIQRVLPKSVIVADDGSCDGSREWLDALPEGVYPFPLFYVTHPHFGYGLTVIENLAARRVKSGRLMFTNADVIHSPVSVESHAEMKEGDISGGHVEGIAMPHSQTVRATDMNRFDDFENKFGKYKGGCSNKEFMIRNPAINFYGIWGGNFSVSTERFHAVNGFDDSYCQMYGGEEADLIQRLMKNGANPAWVYNSMAYHLSHPSRAYTKIPYGNMKYRAEH